MFIYFKIGNLKTEQKHYIFSVVTCENLCCKDKVNTVYLPQNCKISVEREKE